MFPNVFTFPSVSFTKLCPVHNLYEYGNYSTQFSRLKSSMPFKRDLALQNVPLSKQPFKTRPQIEDEDITWSPQYNMSATRTNQRRALSLQEVKLDGWFLILRIVLETCIIQCMHKFNMSFTFHFYILGLMSWIWTNPSSKELKLRALQNETHMRASIFNIDSTHNIETYI